MNACVLAVGSEMLTPFRLDTNSLVITERLNAIGFDVRFKTVIGDDLDELAHVVAAALELVELVVCTGGLGPTEDDLTREAVARVLKLPLELDPAIEAAIRQRFVDRGLAMPAINRRQAMVPRGAEVLPNPNGTAPGLFLEAGRSSIALLPGPPREMVPMLDALIAARLAGRSGGRALFRRTLKMLGRSESDVDSCAQPVYRTWLDRPVPISTTILAVSGQIELHLTAAAPDRATADAALDAAVAQLQAVLGTSVYSIDGRTIEAVVGDLLRQAGWTIAVAESCTGGLLASRLTDVPGSSDYVRAGMVCYSNASKTDWLGVSAADIAAHGAVSEQVAKAMAAGVRERAGADVGVGITGIAGPGGGSVEKPVGTVAVAVETAAEQRVRTFRFPGGRELVKALSAQTAMNMVRLLLLERRAGG